MNEVKLERLSYNITVFMKQFWEVRLMWSSTIFLVALKSFLSLAFRHVGFRKVEIYLAKFLNHVNLLKAIGSLTTAALKRKVKAQNQRWLN